MATDGLVPDLTLWLKVDPAFGWTGPGPTTASRRKGSVFRNGSPRPHEDIARREPNRVVPIDATGSPSRSTG